VAHAAKAEDDGALVLLEYLDGVEDVKQDDGDGDEVRSVVGIGEAFRWAEFGSRSDCKSSEGWWGRLLV